MSKHVAIIGCGQLARLIALAGQEIGVRFTFVAIDNEPTRCVENLGKVVQWRPTNSVISLLKAIGDVDAITVEREDLDTVLLKALDKTGLLRPGADIVLNSKNRLQEKESLSALGVPVTPYVYVATPEELHKAVDSFGFPLVFKSLEQGYDGKNQWRVRDQSELDALAQLYEGFGWIAEPEIQFSAEVSLISVRSVSGEMVFYSLTENVHNNGILHSSIAPAEFVPLNWQVAAQKQIRNLLVAWQYVGVMVTEFFVTDNGLIVNETAPRVHNSGHWTGLGAQTSQFENHLRAILDMPLGSPKETGVAGMINILGGMNIEKGLTVPGFDVHMYNKEDKPGRKLGHANITGDRELVRSQIELAGALLKSA